MIEYTVRVNNDGSKFWYINGKFHREDGPAVEWTNGDKFWYLDGKQYTEKEFKEKQEMVNTKEELKKYLKQMLKYLED